MACPWCWLVWGWVGLGILSGQISASFCFRKSITPVRSRVVAAAQVCCCVRIVWRVCARRECRLCLGFASSVVLFEGGRSVGCGGSCDGVRRRCVLDFHHGRADRAESAWGGPHFVVVGFEAFTQVLMG